MSPSILIFGGSGFVGAHIAKTAKEQGWRTAIAGRMPHPEIDFAEYHQTDVTSIESVHQAISNAKPTVVVNCAAIADIDRAERERELAWQVNVLGAQHIAAACRQHGIRHIFFSTDVVFNGQAELYDERAPTDPVNYYGRTKAAAENAVMEKYPGSVIIRISLAVGYLIAAGNSSLTRLEKQFQQGQEIRMPLDEIRTPIDVLTLSQCVLELAEIDYSGIIHIGALNSLNRYELTIRLAQKMGYPTTLVIPLPSFGEPGRAPRHKNGSLSVTRAGMLLHMAMPTVEQTIERALLSKTRCRTALD
jgi:dTDP-4-dehydrorhamnose reductase